MAEPQRQFTREFKLEAVRLAASGEKPLAQVARRSAARRAYRKSANILGALSARREILMPPY